MEVPHTATTSLISEKAREHQTTGSNCIPKGKKKNIYIYITKVPLIVTPPLFWGGSFFHRKLIHLEGVFLADICSFHPISRQKSQCAGKRTSATGTDPSLEAPCLIWFHGSFTGLPDCTSFQNKSQTRRIATSSIEMKTQSYPFSDKIS